MLVYLAVMCLESIAQEDVIQNTRLAIKAGNAKELIKQMNEMVDLAFDGEKGSYSKTQAEFVLRDFFKKHPPGDFEYIHRGASKEGLRYAIGKYGALNGNFRVVIYIKPQRNNTYLIDLLDFSKE
jgi:hypothetical protein